MTWQIINADCIEAMRDLEDESVDAIVTDPPYGLEFMGKDWDRLGGAVIDDPASVGGYQDPGGGNAYSKARIRYGTSAKSAQGWHEEWAAAALQVLKPGGHLLSFGGTRTYHRMACAIEDAGFEIRDCISWLYGSGFPKSHNLQGDWQGWGTALKPAFEPIVVARKPLIGTVAANVLEHGTGAINVDGCRIGVEGGTAKGTFPNQPSENAYGDGLNGACEIVDLDKGRWPANVVLDPEAGAMLDEQTGALPSGVAMRGNGGGNTFGGENPKPPMNDLGYGDTGGASRFFYCAKTSSAERNAGLEGFEPRAITRYGEQGQGPQPQQTPREPVDQRNVHPTVKPIALMRWLCRLITPPGGTVLDPFNGSGSTGCAAVLEGFDYIGIEREAEYVSIAEARIQWWAAHPEGMEFGDRIKADKARLEIADAGQLDMFGEAA